MGFVALQLVCLVLKICAAASSLLIQESAGHIISSSPATFPGVHVGEEGTPSSITNRKPFGNNATSPDFHLNGKDLHHSLVVPPPYSAPYPQIIDAGLPILSPTTSRTLPPHSTASPTTNDQGFAHSFQPIAPQIKPPLHWDASLAPKASVPVASPSRKSPQGTHHGRWKSIPPTSDHNETPDFAASVPAPVTPESYRSPSTSPNTINWKREGKPFAAFPHGKSHHIQRKDKPIAASPRGHLPIISPSLTNATRHSYDAPQSPPDVGHLAPAPLPSPAFHRQNHNNNNVKSPCPSSDLVPPSPLPDRAPLYPPKLHPKINKTKPALSYPNPDFSPSPSHSALPPSRSYVSPAPSLLPSRQTTGQPKVVLPPPIPALPPPPPNEDCASLTCTEPLTNTPPGTPCSCVWPMKVGLRLSVALYTFFPLVSELAKEISVGVYMKLSQVRIMGANAASEDPEKTIVLLNLVPFGERFNSTTAYLTYERFWNKKIIIEASLFSDYEVLYVRYPGLPPSPPLPPSSINIINSEPYSGHDNNGLKPLGVDVTRQHHKNGLNGSIITVIALSASMALILCCAVLWILVFKHREDICQPEVALQTTIPLNAKASGIPASITGSGHSSASVSFASSMAYTGSARTFSSSEIERATGNFNTSRILGEGGFGRVYSGVLDDGTKVAVKVLKRDDQQGGREFLAEVEMLSRLHHRNLVKLIGICIEDRTRCLVYELVPNGSVESHLHGVDKERAPLDWGSRMKIALGAARGLAYLHEDSSPRVIHRDFKSSNILLEHDFTPKVSDFGLARTALDEGNGHISTRVMGTFGYVAPEYAMTGHLLVKSDVYSYGVVLLELLTGRKPVDMSQPPGQENLVAWTRPLLTSKQGFESIVDPSLGPDFPFDGIAKVAAIASMCVQPEVSHRPFMGEVVQALKLVCNDTEETKGVGSRSCSQEDLSFEMDVRISNTSDHFRDPLQNQSPLSNYDSGVDVERGLPVSEIFGSSERYGRQDSSSFRRHSSSGPLGTSKGKRLWQKMRGLDGGSVSEHGLAFKLWRGSR